MSEKDKVLVIDDDEIFSLVIKTVLSPHFDVYLAHEGCAGLEQVKILQPGVVLLDIEMVGMDGYEVCCHIRADVAIEQPAIIFVSAHTDAQSRLAAYDMGANDFIIKPLEPAELERKVTQTLAARSEVQQLKQSAGEAMNAAFSAMTDSSALGQVIHTFRQLFTVQTPEQLAILLTDALEYFGVTGTVRLCSRRSHCVLRSSHGIASQMDRVLLDHITKDANRIISYGARTVFNYDAAALLVKDMPLDDPDRYGRLKDYLALLVEGAAQCMRSLETTSLESLLSQAKRIFSQIEQGYHRQNQEMSFVLNEMAHDFEEMFLFMGLKSSQEDRLRQILNDSLEHIQGVQEQGLELEKYMELITQALADPNPDTFQTSPKD